jgi:hypothetical protein
MTRDYIRVDQPRSGEYVHWLCDRAMRDRGRALAPSTIDALLSRLRTAEIRAEHMGTTLLGALQDSDQCDALLAGTQRP